MDTPRTESVATGADPAGALAPIVVKVAVPCPPDRAFAYFTRDIDKWWPRATHSVSEDACVGVAIEPHVGGAILESSRDGARHRWGTVSRWEPGVALAFSWHPGGDEATAQWVDVVFAPTSTGTLVTLTQGGWEKLGDDARRAREGYTAGWTTILGEIYKAYCAAPPGERTN